MTIWVEYGTPPPPHHILPSEQRECSSGEHRDTSITNKKSMPSHDTFQTRHREPHFPLTLPPPPRPSNRVMHAEEKNTVPNCFMCCFKHSLRTSSSPTLFSAPCPQASMLNIPAIYSVSIPSLWPIISMAIGCKVQSQRKIPSKQSFSMPSQAWGGRGGRNWTEEWSFPKWMEMIVVGVGVLCSTLYRCRLEREGDHTKIVQLAKCKWRILYYAGNQYQKK